MKKLYKILVTSMAAALIIAGCSSAGGETLQLEGTSWTLVGLDGRPALANSELTIQFEDGKAGGSSGCNHYSGEYTLGSADSITFGLMASTMMACDQGLMDQETAFLQLLAEVATAQFEGSRLTMKNADGIARLIFEQIVE